MLLDSARCPQTLQLFDFLYKCRLCITGVLSGLLVDRIKLYLCPGLQEKPCNWLAEGKPQDCLLRQGSWGKGSMAGEAESRLLKASQDAPKITLAAMNPLAVAEGSPAVAEGAPVLAAKPNQILHSQFC